MSQAFHWDFQSEQDAPVWDRLGSSISLLQTSEDSNNIPVVCSFLHLLPSLLLEPTENNQNDGPAKYYSFQRQQGV
jgi:hypothetical protein